MKCTACGNDNQPSAKFCVHCGVFLSTVSAPAPARSVGSSTISMPAAPPVSRPAAPTPPPPPPPQPESFIPEPAPMSTGAIPAAPVPEPVAASSSSSRTGLIIGVVAALVVIAAGFVGYRALYGGSKPSVTASEAPKAIQPAAAPAAEPAKEATPVAAAPAEPPTPAPAAAPTEEPPKTATSEPSALPGTPAPPPKTRPAQAKAAAKAEPSAAEPVPAPAPAKTPAKAATVAAAPAATMQPDHWQMYADAMGRCAREDFFKRLGCELRTRNQYCQGYWGTVPQCPEATPRDRGQ